MKNLILVFSVLFLFSCGLGSTDNKTEDEKDNTKESVTENEDSKSSEGSCEEFLVDYEKWVDEMIVVIKKAKSNPLDLSNTKRMMEATTKLSEWMEKWTNLYDCANNEEYTKKMEELQKKVEKELGE